MKKNSIILYKNNIIYIDVSDFMKSACNNGITLFFYAPASVRLQKLETCILPRGKMAIGFVVCVLYVLTMTTQ